MTENVHVHEEAVEGCRMCAEVETQGCQAIVVQGRFYLSNGDPGFPDEYCDSDAAEGSVFCSDHQAEDFWDAADRQYEEARERRMEENDDRLAT